MAVRGRSPEPVIWACVVVLALVTAACVSSGGASPTSTGTHHTSTPSTPTCADSVFERLSLPQRVGQLFALGLEGDRLGPDERDAIRSHHVGSVWFTETTTEGASAVGAVAAAVQALATNAATGGVGFYVAANQEGGEIQALRGAGFSTMPSALTQGTLEPSALQADASTWGQELSEAGVNMDFAPVMDVVPPGTDAQNQPIGALQRGYGHDPATVSAHAIAFMRGMDQAGITTTGKHFPGLGRVTGNTDFTAAVVDDVTTTTDPYLAPFRDAIGAGVPMVMVALAKYQKIDPTTLAVFSTPVMRNLLRDSLNFTGVVVSDDLGATAAVANIAPADRAINFLLAGGDLIISKTIAPANAMAAAISARASGGGAFKTRVDDAALRVLRSKVARGLVRC